MKSMSLNNVIRGKCENLKFNEGTAESLEIH